MIIRSDSASVQCLPYDFQLSCYHAVCNKCLMSSWIHANFFLLVHAIIVLVLYVIFNFEVLQSCVVPLTSIFNKTDEDFSNAIANSQ